MTRSGRDPHWPLILRAGAAALAAGSAHAQAWRFHEPHVLGASLDMAVVSADPASALAAARAARAEIARLDAILSGWRPDSELAALNARTDFAASPDLFAVVQAAERWRAITGGAFDGRLGRVTQAWRQPGGPPDATRLRALDAEARALDVMLDPASRRIRRPEGAVLDLDGIAKGHVIDSALTAARHAAPGIDGLMIDIGGDVKVWGQAPGPQGWRIGVADPARLQDNARPFEALRLTDQAVAFSGPSPRDPQPGHSHLLAADGAPARRISAAVTADSTRDADALATALCVLEPDDAIALVDRLDGFEALVIDESGHRLPSRGWNALTESQAAPARLIRAQAAQPWPPGFALTLDYELPQSPRTRAQPPYVAVWITDHAGVAIRTLTLLGSDDRFIDQNFIWWRKVGRLSAGFDAIARPTRRPGRYSLVWDGRDDKGAPVGQGRYTIHIEATREHGGHGYQTVDMVLGAEPAAATAPAEDELGPSGLRYGPRP
jgi:thiamine biosynthesis lipoprotein